MTVSVAGQQQSVGTKSRSTNARPSSTGCTASEYLANTTKQTQYCVYSVTKNNYYYCTLPSVLWRCWLGDRKGIQHVKNLSGGVLTWLSVWSEMQACIWPSWCNCHSLSLASVKSTLVLPFWDQLTRVVRKKGPLNGCVCVLHPFNSLFSRTT